MPAFELHLTASFDGATRVSVGADYVFHIGMKCGRCSTVCDKVRQPVFQAGLLRLRTLRTPQRSCPPAQTSVFSASDVCDVPGSRGTAALVQKCKECSSVFSCDVLSKPGGGLSADADPAPAFAIFECRGCEPQRFEAGDGWTVEGPSQSWKGVNLDSDDWCEYDEAAQVSVAVSELRGTFKKAK